MVFRKEKGNDGFQRQFSALRQQLGGHGAEEEDDRDNATSNLTAPDVSESDERAPLPSYGQPDPDPYGRGDSLGAVPAPSSAPAVPEATAPPAFDPSSIASGEDVSIIAHDAVWDGDLRTNGSLHVHGTVKGTLAATESVYVAEEANVDGSITARHVVVGGLVKGSVDCSVRFEALAAGRLLADVHAPSVVIHEGATMRGEFVMAKSGTSDEKSGQSYRRGGRHR